MAINIVFDYPGHQTSRSLARMVASLVGALLVTLGLLATVVAIPSGFVTLGDVIGTWQHEQVYEPGFPVREIEAAFAASTIVAFVGLRYGRRLIRGRRVVSAGVCRRWPSPRRCWWPSSLSWRCSWPGVPTGDR